MTVAQNDNETQILLLESDRIFQNLCFLADATPDQGPCKTGVG